MKVLIDETRLDLGVGEVIIIIECVLSRGVSEAVRPVSTYRMRFYRTPQRGGHFFYVIFKARHLHSDASISAERGHPRTISSSHAGYYLCSARFIGGAIGL